MGLIVLIILIVLIFGGGGGYYAHRNYGGAGLGGVLGTVVLYQLSLIRTDVPSRAFRWT